MCVYISVYVYIYIYIYIYIHIYTFIFLEVQSDGSGKIHLSIPKWSLLVRCYCLYNHFAILSIDSMFNYSV